MAWRSPNRILPAGRFRFESESTLPSPRHAAAAAPVAGGHTRCSMVCSSQAATATSKQRQQVYRVRCRRLFFADAAANSLRAIINTCVRGPNKLALVGSSHLVRSGIMRLARPHSCCDVTQTRRRKAKVEVKSAHRVGRSKRTEERLFRTSSTAATIARLVEGPFV